MKNRKSLKVIPIEQNTNEPIRKFDAMSRKQKYYFLFLLAAVNFLFFASHKYGPPFYHIETIPFKKGNIVSSTRKFFLKIGDFNFLNDFITLDMILLKNYQKEERNHVDVSISVKSIKGKRSEILYYQNSKQYEIIFNTESKVSNKIRLFSREIVDFVRLESDLVLKFHYDESTIDDDLQYSGAFIFTYIDASYTIIEALLRLIFFIFSIIWFCYFNSIDFSKTSSPLQLKLIYFVLILTVFSSNPLYVLSYFTESHFLSFIDSVFSTVLVFSVLAVTLIILDSTHADQFKNTKKWLLIESLPFLILCSFFIVDDFYNHYSDDSNDLHVKLFNFVKFLGISFCYVIVLVSTILFKAKNYLEKGIVILMILITILTTVFFEYIEPIESLIPTNHVIQIYTFASVATYVFFLAFFYMPVDPMSASDDINEYNNLADDDDSYDVADPM